MHPARVVSLRTIDPDRYAIVDVPSGSVLEEIESGKAFYEVYEGAVYLFQGATHLCTRLDLNEKKAYVRRADLKYYTKPIDVTDVHVIGGTNAYSALGTAERALLGVDHEDEEFRDLTVEAEEEGDLNLEIIIKKEEQGGGGEGGGGRHYGRATGHTYHGYDGGGDDPRLRGPRHVPRHVSSRLACGVECSDAYVTTQWVGYHKLWRSSGEIFETIHHHLPDTHVTTRATQWRAPPSLGTDLASRHLPFREGLHAATHAILHVLPLLVVCDPGDVLGECDSPYTTRFRPERLLLYDAQGGGVGLSDQAARIFPALLRRALRLLEHCPCARDPRGCPACTQHASCRQYNATLHKEAAKEVLRQILAREEAHGGGGHDEHDSVDHDGGDGGGGGEGGEYRHDDDGGDGGGDGDGARDQAGVVKAEEGEEGGGMGPVV